MQRTLGRFVNGCVQQADRRTDEYAVLHRLQHVERLFIGMLAVIDHVHPAPHRALH